jgi:hypothetical protein
MKHLKFVLFLAFGLLVLGTAPACKTKSGCPSNEQVQPKVNRKGEIKNKRRGNSSQLFDKKMRKRMGSR